MENNIKDDPNYEKYKAELAETGIDENDYGFESLFLLHKHLNETPEQELKKEWEEIEALGLKGPTVEEYFASLNPQYQYQKGFSDGAKAFKDSLIDFINKELEKNPDELSFSGLYIIQEVKRIYEEE